MNPEVKVVNKNRVGLGVPVWFIGWLFTGAVSAASSL